jgi:hypothetical protein
MLAGMSFCRLVSRNSAEGTKMDGEDAFLLSGMEGVTIFIGPCSITREGDIRE